MRVKHKGFFRPEFKRVTFTFRKRGITKKCEDEVYDMRPNDKKGDKKVIELDKAKYTKDLYTCGEPQGVPVDQEVEFMTGYKDK